MPGVVGSVIVGGALARIVLDGTLPVTNLFLYSSSLRISSSIKLENMYLRTHLPKLTVHVSTAK